MVSRGKRQAVIYFLSAVLRQNRPQTLLLFSDEATDWMTADPAFAANWASLMMQVLARGNRIKIIHTVSRDLDEMLNAISQWMPLYMSGLIEPYFYPKKRDGVFKRTLFIAPETAAVISTSIGNTHQKAANILFTDMQAIASFAAEYEQYLSLCRPLMRIFTANDQEAYFNTLLEFEKEQNASMIKTESLSLLTMPVTVVSRILTRLGQTNQLAEYHQKRRQLFENNIAANPFTEIVRLHDSKTLANAEVKVALSDMLKGGAAYYTAEEYILHLEHLVYLLQTYDRFQVHLLKEDTENRYMVYAREELGVIVAKTSAAPVILAINESNMTMAFWDFLINMVQQSYSDKNKEDTIRSLTAHIQRLKKSPAIRAAAEHPNDL